MIAYGPRSPDRLAARGLMARAQSGWPYRKAEWTGEGKDGRRRCLVTAPAKVVATQTNYTDAQSGVAELYVFHLFSVPVILPQEIVRRSQTPLPELLGRRVETA